MSQSYALDASTIVLVNREMPRDVHVSLWSALEDLITTGRLVMPREVLEELKRVDDGLQEWARQFEGFVVEPTEAEVAVVMEIGIRHPGWIDQQKNAADPWLVAHGACHGLAILTQERPRGPGAIAKNLMIPNVAAGFGVSCADLNALARQEGWAF